MATEIERKFLVASDSWRKLYTTSDSLRDGLLASSNGRKVRVRIYEKRATLTIKSKQQGSERSEYEYEIPIADAEELLTSHCDGNILAKTRYYVPYRGFIWEVDVYDGILSGVVLAEVEIERADIDVPLPSWIGREITGEPQYRKINMLEAWRDQLRE